MWFNCNMFMPKSVQFYVDGIIIIESELQIHNSFFYLNAQDEYKGYVNRKFLNKRPNTNNKYEEM